MLTRSRFTSSNWRGVARCSTVVVRLRWEKFPLPAPINSKHHTELTRSLGAGDRERTHKTEAGIYRLSSGTNPNDCNVSPIRRRRALNGFPFALYTGAVNAFQLLGAWKISQGKEEAPKKNNTHTEKPGYYGYSSYQLRLKARLQPPGCRSEEGSRGLGASLRRTCSPPNQSASPPTGRSTWTCTPPGRWTGPRPAVCRGMWRGGRKMDYHSCVWLWMGNDACGVFIQRNLK